MREFRLFDSALPIGSFNFSSTVEEAFLSGYDVKEYISSLYRNVVLRGDVVAVKVAFRDPFLADELVFASKLTREMKDSSVSMGRALADLGLCNTPFLEAVRGGETPGTYPAVVGEVCKCQGIDLRTCMEGVAYSELSQMVYSAVKLGAMDFHEGQDLLSSLMEFREYEEFFPCNPVTEVLSVSHESREPKMFNS
ncbi:urease accessory protein UreF [Sulfuracidifex tepidarius]|uniref:Urease accessory protein UreF n=1 Tax=Sulfuracidifex tepidarius TaxID=1294262 RepID=A0A510DYP6_9CREN|nr:urease accessory UreF family protein [Sulfuracidifex tepidarius]BBG25080.1 Urease accessory protein UreF [Sulfuracidifex tepidarius]BBG27862.1 Urease accessory protein UreF [Sulfuracidifex tepidarius]